MAIDFRLKDFAHPLLIAALRRKLERSQWMDPALLRAEQDRLLRETVRHACAEVPHYREQFDALGLSPDAIRGADDLTRLPLLTRETVSKQGERLYASRARPTIGHTTSGTTGSPLALRFDARANALEFVYYWRHWSWAGYRLGDPFAELGLNHFLRRPVLGGAAAAWQPHLRRLMLNSALVSDAAAPEMARAMRDRGVRYIKGMPSTLYCFARCLERAGGGGFGLRAAFCNGELLTPGVRVGIGDAFQCPVLDSYGHMERTVAVSQCLEGGYHVNSDYGVLELLDAGPGAAPNERRAVGTSLYNRAMPLIRYEVGDTIECAPDDAVCRCGRTLPLVGGVRGRLEDVVVTPEGRYVTGMFILPELVAGVELAQFVQERREALEIRIVPRAGWDERQGSQLLAHARRLVGPSMLIEVREVAEDEIRTDASGKRRVVVSDLGRWSADAG